MTVVTSVTVVRVVTEVTVATVVTVVTVVTVERENFFCHIFLYLFFIFYMTPETGKLWGKKVKNSNCDKS